MQQWRTRLRNVALTFGLLAVGLHSAGLGWPTTAAAQDMVQALTPTELTPGRDEDGDGAPDGPALWRVRDADTTVYLFGTLHVLPAKLAWRRANVQAAFERSQIVYFEADTESWDAIAELDRLIIQHGHNAQGVRLSRMLSKQGRQRLADWAAQLGLPLDDMESMRPWLVAVSMGDAGAQVRPGVEADLWPDALSARKDIRFLEDGGDVVINLAEVADADWVDMLEATLEERETNPYTVRQMAGAWFAGDLVALNADVQSLRTNHPAIFDVLITERNKAWMDELRRVMESEVGEVFVAVGVLHLIGSQSLQRSFAEAGWVADRL